MLNKRGGWKKFQKLINGEVPIRAWRVEKVSKINKRASLFIRQVRVTLSFFLKVRLQKLDPSAQTKGYNQDHSVFYLHLSKEHLEMWIKSFHCYFYFTLLILCAIECSSYYHPQYYEVITIPYI